MKPIYKIYIVLLLSVTAIAYGWNQELDNATKAISDGTATTAQKQLIIQEQKRQYKNEDLTKPHDKYKAKTFIGTARTTISSSSEKNHKTSSSQNKTPQKRNIDYKDIKSENTSATLVKGIVDSKGLKNDILKARADASKATSTVVTTDTASKVKTDTTTKKLSKGEKNYIKRTNKNNKNYGKGKGQKHYKGNKKPNAQRNPKTKTATPTAPDVQPTAGETTAKAVEIFTGAANIAETGREIRKLIKGEIDASTAFKNTADRLTDGGVTAAETLYTKGDDLVATKEFKNFIQEQNVKERAHQVGLELHKNGVSKNERQKIMQAMWKGDDTLLDNKIKELNKQNITINVPDLKKEKGSGYQLDIPIIPGMANKNMLGVEGDDNIDERIIDTLLGMGKGLYEGGKSIVLIAVETGTEVGNLAGEHIYTKGRDFATEIAELKNVFQADDLRQKLIENGANPKDVDEALKKLYESGDRSGFIDIKYELAAAKKAAEEAAKKKAADDAAKKKKEQDTDNSNDIANIKNDNEPPPDDDITEDDDDTTDDPKKPDNDNSEDDDIASSGDKKKKTDDTTDDDDKNNTFDDISEEDMEDLFEDAFSDKKPDKTDNSENSNNNSISALQDAENGSDFEDGDGFNDDDFSEDEPDQGEVFADKTDASNQDDSKNAQTLNESFNEIANASTAGDKTRRDSENVVNEANVNAQHTVNVAMNESNADYNENSFGNQLNTEITDGIRTGFETAGTAIGTAIGEAVVRQSIRDNNRDDRHGDKPAQNTTRKPPRNNTRKPPRNNTRKPPSSNGSSITASSGNRWPVCPVCGRRHKPGSGTRKKPPQPTRITANRPPKPSSKPSKGNRFNIKNSHAIPHYSSQVQPTATKKKTEIRHTDSVGSVWYTDK